MLLELFPSLKHLNYCKSFPPHTQVYALTQIHTQTSQSEHRVLCPNVMQTLLCPIRPCIRVMLGYPASKENKLQEEQMLSSMTCWGQLCADAGG